MRRRVSDCWAANADAAAAVEVAFAFSVLSYQVMQARFHGALYGTLWFAKYAQLTG